MASSAELNSTGMSGSPTGTDDATYNLTSVLYHALQGVENCTIYAEDAEGDEQRQFFEQICQQQKQIAEQAKRLLHDNLMQGMDGMTRDGNGAHPQIGSSGGEFSSGAGGAGASDGKTSQRGEAYGLSGPEPEQL